MNVLILVDIQNDFLPDGALAVPDGEKVIPIAIAGLTSAQSWQLRHESSREEFDNGHRKRTGLGEWLKAQGAGLRDATGTCETVQLKAPGRYAPSFELKVSEQANTNSDTCPVPGVRSSPLCIASSVNTKVAEVGCGNWK